MSIWFSVNYGNLRTRYQVPRNAAILRALRPCAFFTASCLVYCGSWPIVRALRGYPDTASGRDIDAALAGALTGVVVSAMWIRNSRFVGVSIPVAYILGGVSAGLYNSAHAGYATNRSVLGGWSDMHHWNRGHLFFGPTYEERAARFQAQLKNARYREHLETSVKTSWWLSTNNFQRPILFSSHFLSLFLVFFWSIDVYVDRKKKKTNVPLCPLPRKELHIFTVVF